mgnify:CR=1 FL=1
MPSTTVQRRPESTPLYGLATPGPTYTFGEAETVDQTEYLPLMRDGKRTGMLMRQEEEKVYMRITEEAWVSTTVQRRPESTPLYGLARVMKSLSPE